MIYDSFGNPVQSAIKFVPAADNSGTNRRREIVQRKSIDELIPEVDHEMLVYVCNKLYYSCGIVRAAIDQRAMYSVGRAFEPKFLGENKEWGKKATEWLTEKWFPTCDVRGKNHDWATGLHLDSVHIDRDGDVGCIYTETEAGWPQLQRVSAYRIGNPRGMVNHTKLTEGPYKGYRVVKGVVINERETPIAYHIRGAENDGSEDKYVAAKDMDFTFDSTSHDSVRGLPCFTASLTTFRDMLQSTEWEMRAILIAGTVALIEHNDTGMANPLNDIRGGDVNTQKEIRNTEITDIEGGMYKYVKAGTGSKIEQVQQARPGGEWREFMDMGIRSALAEMGWSMSLVWKPTGQGTAERMEIAKAERAVQDRQAILTGLARRRVGWAISKAIKIGELPPYPGADIGGFLRWGFTYPAKLTVDYGRDWATQLDAWRAGIINATEIIEQSGKTYADVIRERAYEVASRKRIAMEVSAETGVPISEQDMSMKSMNDMGRDYTLSVEEELENQRTENHTGDATQTENQP
jgi:capsid protein